jgi:hypothetical protein
VANIELERHLGVMRLKLRDLLMLKAGDSSELREMIEGLNLTIKFSGSALVGSVGMPSAEQEEKTKELKSQLEKALKAQ